MVIVTQELDEVLILHIKCRTKCVSAYKSSFIHLSLFVEFNCGSSTRIIDTLYISPTESQLLHTNLKYSVSEEILYLSQVGYRLELQAQ